MATSRANDLANLMSSTTVGTRDLTLDSDFSANTIADTIGDVRTPRVDAPTNSNHFVSGSGISYLDDATTTTLTISTTFISTGDVRTVYNSTGAAVTLAYSGFTFVFEDGSGTNIVSSTATLADNSLLTVTVVSSTVIVLSSANLTVT
jgi:hypothetical protein